VLVVLDANIWISAFQFGGKPQAVVQMALDSDLEVAISASVIEETTRILRTKFGWDADGLARVRDTMELHARLVTPTETLDAVPDDPDDNRVVECAKAAGADIIVTGDKDLLRMRSYEGIAIVTAADFLRERLRER
jgi:putative PIN family toxin of toxin-antitoxin system